MTIALQKAKNQNPGGCKCTSLHLPAGALVSIVVSLYCNGDSMLCWLAVITQATSEPLGM